MTAVIFDCDGTLVDSEPLARAAWQRALAPHGYTATEADFEAVTGLPFGRTHAFFAERAPLPAAAAFWPVYSGELFALFDAELVPFEDAVGAARELRARGVPVAVASSSTRERLDFALRRVGLAGEFDVTVAGDEVEHGKPAPDMFLAAAAGLGVEPGGCVVVEDSAPGVEAGRAAGMATLGVRRLPGAEAALGAADALVERVSAEAILELARARRA